jgi:hypothetical protein
LYHPTRDSLERFACGELSTVEAAQIESHLRSGCAICQPAVDSLLPGRGEAAGQLELAIHDHSRPAAPSLGAPRATRASRTLQTASRPTSLSPLTGNRPGPHDRPDRPDRPEGAAEDPYASDPLINAESSAEIWNRMFANVERRVMLITAERQPAPQLLAELLSRSPEERMRCVRASRRFQTLALCDLLIESSGEAVRLDRRESMARAELAILMAQHLDEGDYGAAIVHDLQARGWAFLCRARRRSPRR